MVPIVVVIKDNVVDMPILCESPEHQEKVFLQQLEDHISNWDEYTLDDIEAIKENGFEKFGNGSVCMCFAMTPEEIEGN